MEAVHKPGHSTIVVDDHVISPAVACEIAQDDFVFGRNGRTRADDTELMVVGQLVGSSVYPSGHLACGWAYDAEVSPSIAY